MQGVHVAKQHIWAAVRTLDQLVVGELHVRPQKRLKDELNLSNERFLALTDARVYDAEGTTLLYRTSFMLISNAHIVSVAPIEKMQNGPDTRWNLQLPVASSVPDP